MRNNLDSTPELSEASKKTKKQLSPIQKVKRFAFAALLGATAGTGAIEADQHVTHGLFQGHLRSFMTEPRYRDKLGESILTGEILGDASDLLQAAESQASASQNETESEGFVSSQLLGEKLSVESDFLTKYFHTYEIRIITDKQNTEIKRPVYFAKIDSPEIVDFNIGSDNDPDYDPTKTVKQIGSFATIPTNQTDKTKDGESVHVFFSAYNYHGQIKEYSDVPFQEKGRDPRVIRAGALVLFSKEGVNSVIAFDSRDFNLHINDVTEYGTVQAIESYGASITSKYEAEDIESLKKLIGDQSKLQEYTRRNYNSVIVTYTFDDKPPQTYIFGIYTDPKNLPSGVKMWDSTRQLTPQDFYSLVAPFGEELKATGSVTLLADPGASSNLYTEDEVMGEQTGALFHSKNQIRPRYSLVQKGIG